ncbi:hypothetical protein LTS18_003036, partial [Coniosporium uncinatum]
MAGSAAAKIKSLLQKKEKEKSDAEQLDAWLKEMRFIRTHRAFMLETAAPRYNRFEVVALAHRSGKITLRDATIAQVSAAFSGSSIEVSFRLIRDAVEAVQGGNALFAVNYVRDKLKVQPAFVNVARFRLQTYIPDADVARSIFQGTFNRGATLWKHKQQELMPESWYDLAWIAICSGQPRIMIERSWDSTDPDLPSNQIDMTTTPARQYLLNTTRAEQALDVVHRNSVIDQYSVQQFRLVFALLGNYSISNDQIMRCFELTELDFDLAIHEGQIRWLQSLNPNVSWTVINHTLHRCRWEMRMETSSHRKGMFRAFHRARKIWAALPSTHELEKAGAASEVEEGAWMPSTQAFRSLNYETRSPPDVGRNTHIVAVCGINDALNDEASPMISGWILSDFYLWLHVTKGMAKSEKWLCCDDPEKLLEKYCHGDRARIEQRTSAHGDRWPVKVQSSWDRGYLHGDPYEDQKVVLDRDNVNDVRARLTDGGRGVALRDRFLADLEATCTTASAKNDPVLVMIFAHGITDGSIPGGVQLGISSKSVDMSELLSPQMLSDVTRKFPDLQITLFMTSCFSGHWVVHPSFGLEKPPAIMVGAHEDEETFSWPMSQSQRHYGGIWTSAALQELMRNPTPDSDSLQTLPTVIDAPPADQRTYLGLQYRAIRTIRYFDDIERSGASHGSTPIFDQNNLFDSMYERTGFDMTDFKSNYDALPTVPARDPDPRRDRKACPPG